MPLTYTTFHVPQTRTFLWTIDLLSMQARNADLSVIYSVINYDVGTGTWIPDPLYPNTIVWNPAFLATLSYDSQPAALDMPVAATDEPYEVRLFGLIGRAASIAQYDLFPVDIPPQPPPPVTKPPFPYTRLHRYDWPRTRQGPRSS